MLGKLSAVDLRASGSAEYAVHKYIFSKCVFGLWDEVRVAPSYCSLSLLSLLVLIINNPTVRIRGITVSLGNFQLTNCRWRLKEMKKDQ